MALRGYADWTLDGYRTSALALGVAGENPIFVVCALIERDGRVLTARRAPGKAQGGKWEFPGGKLLEGESPRDALAREIREELRIEIDVGDALAPSNHDYGEFQITLLPFKCAITAGEPAPVEHEEIAWLEAGELTALDWAAADVPIAASYAAAAMAEGGSR